MMDGWGMAFGGWIWMAVWVVALLVMVWFVVSGGRRPETPDADAILRQRFARGEIDEAEFRHLRDVLAHEGGKS